MRQRYVQRNGELVRVDPNWTPEPRSDYHIMGDIEPYRSMIDGSVISSRSRHREHLRAHGCVEVGNDSIVMNPKRKPLESPPGLKETLIRATNEIERRDRR